MRLLAFVLVGVLPGVAQAAVGSTFYVGPGASSAGLGGGTVWGLGANYPSLDIYAGEFVIQLHVLELVQGLTDSTIYLGANAQKTVLAAPAGLLDGVVQPGISLDVVSDTGSNSTVLQAGGLVRLGVESKKSMGFGIYVVPELGLSLVDGEVDLLTGGTLQFGVRLP